ncbi:MAG: sulfotransferase family protein, partial [Sphaerospermopsis kisseleviana]
RMNKKSTSGLLRALELVQPAFLSGFTFPQWIRLLNENRWDIDAKYLPRAFIATAGTIATSFLKPFEPVAKLDEDGEKLWRRPVFILGLPRSGTTYLFNLLAQDPQFAYPARIDSYNPHTLLLLRKLGLHQLLAKLPAKKRFMDNIRTGWLSPEEDNVALTVLTGAGSRLIQVFNRNEKYRAGFSPSGRMSAQQRVLFTAAISSFSKKLVFLHRARPLFKCPIHTRHIAEILDTFPDAKFLTIFRNPFSQFASLKAMHHSVSKDWSALQKGRILSDDTRLASISSILKSYMETRALIPQGHLCEIQYSELVRQQEACIQKFYSALDFGTPPDRTFQAAKEAYQKNSHPPLDSELQSRIRSVYEPFVKAGLFDPADLA